MTELYPQSLKIVSERLFEPLGYFIENFMINPESQTYDACSFTINKKQFQFRRAKITSVKTGQFVSIWKRNEMGITQPYDLVQNLDVILVVAFKERNKGLFIFPATVLVEKNIISQNGKGGKRGIRVYPPWDNTESKQAKKTQTWQLDYFLSINENIDLINLDIKKLSNIFK